jgi:fatty acid desaturase
MIGTASRQGLDKAVRAANHHAEHHRFPAATSLNLHRLHKALPQPHPIQEKSHLRFHANVVKSLLWGTTPNREDDRCQS